MKHLLPLLLLAGCTTVGTLHNPACLIFCDDKSSPTISTTK